MDILLGSIADDYTGASDLANTLTKNGLRTVQTVGIPDEALELPDVDAVVVAMKIRSVAANDAVAAATAADAWLRRRGARHVLYKICSTFDSTAAGNIGPVTEALSSNADGVVLVTPAFPETGRTVYLGHLFVGREPLNESPLKDHPLNPMHDANLVRVMAAQSQGTVGLVDLQTIAAGPNSVAAKLATLKAQCFATAIADAVFERDLETLGEVALQARSSTGASGLGLGLARALARSGQVPERSDTAGEIMRPVGGLAAAIAGSCSRMTLRQLEVAEQSMPVLRLDPERLLAGGDEIAAAIAWAGDRIAAGPVVIAASANAEAVARLQSRHGREASGHTIEAATSAIAAELVARGVKRLVIAGGETSGAAVDRLAIPAFLIGPEIAPGVPVLRTIGGAHGAMLLALKSGNFGAETFFTDALEVMR